jgi:hypothetical protein
VTNGQIAQLQELNKCHMQRWHFEWVDLLLLYLQWDRDTIFDARKHTRLSKNNKAFLRYLWHQYRNQIKAMKRNRL